MLSISLRVVIVHVLKLSNGLYFARKLGPEVLGLFCVDEVFTGLLFLFNVKVFLSKLVNGKHCANHRDLQK